jgi:hypothetical protein
MAIANYRCGYNGMTSQIIRPIYGKYRSMASLVVFFLLGLAGGCGRRTVQPAATTPAPAAAGATCAICPVAVDAQGSTAFSSTPLPARPTCTAETIGAFPIPDPKCTPGAINPSITLLVLDNPLFRTGCIRNCVTSESAKAKTYDWYGTPHPPNNTGANQVCELDHLVPLEMGGADTLDNIWPQCGPDGVTLNDRFFKQKDLVENYLTAQVKHGAMDLMTAQREIARDWTQFLEAARSACSTPACAN